MRLTAAQLLTVFFALVICVSSQTPRGPLFKSHRHIALDNGNSVDIPEFSMVEISLERNIKRANLVTSNNRKRDAFTVDDTRLFVSDRTTKKVLEITGLPLEWRPFSNLTWASNDTLMFDRWSQPHYGVHYEVNVRSRKLLIAAPFPDKFYLEQQRPKRQTKEE